MLSMSVPPHEQPLDRVAIDRIILALDRHVNETEGPAALGGVRLLTVSYRGFDGRTHQGEMVVNATAAQPLAGVFRRLYALHFPIRHMSFADFYGPLRGRPRDGDVTGSFSCRQAVP